MIAIIIINLFNNMSDSLKKFCLTCGKQYEKKPYDSLRKWRDKKFCSQKCHYEAVRTKKVERIPWIKGRTKDNDPRVAAYAKKLKGRKGTMLGRKGKDHPMWGRKLSKEWRKNIGNANKREAHWNWQGGKTDEIQALRRRMEYKGWCDKVREKDNYICQDCGKKEGNRHLDCHHELDFKDFEEYRYDIENGVALCQSCHGKRHYKQGSGLALYNKNR